MRVLAVRLLRAPPAHVAGEVDDGREDHADTAASGLCGNCARDAADKGGVECCGQRDGLREDGGARTHEAVQRFLERDHRDTEPRAFDEVALDGIDARRVCACVSGVAHLEPEHAVRPIVRRIVEAARQHEELPELLLQRHASEKVPDALVDGLTCGRGGEHEEERCGAEDGREHAGEWALAGSHAMVAGELALRPATLV